MLTPVLRRGLRRARLSATMRLQRSGVRLACETTAQHAPAVRRVQADTESGPSLGMRLSSFRLLN